MEPSLSEPKEKSPGYAGSLTWDLAIKERWGLATRMGLKCAACPFTFDRHNLFKDVDTNAPGRKPATLNYSLQVGLSQTLLGNDGMKKILLSTNTPAPSCKSMQKTSNRVLAKIETLNTFNMRCRCRQLDDVNVVRGHKSPQKCSATTLQPRVFRGRW